MTQKLIPITLPNGVEAALRYVSQEVFFEIQESNPPPKPPQEAIERPDGSIEMRDNPAHPDYAKALSDHNRRMTFLVRDFVIKRALVLHLNEDQKQEVADLRADLLEVGVKLPDDDKLVYVTRIACTTFEQSKGIISKATEAWGVTPPKSQSGNGDSTPVSEA